MTQGTTEQENNLLNFIFKNISRQNRQWQWQANKFEHGQQYAGAKSKEKGAESSKSTKGRLWKDAESAKENKETQGAT